MCMSGFVCMNIRYVPCEYAVPAELRRGHQISWDWSCKALSHRVRTGN